MPTPIIHLVALCYTCKKRHEYRVSPARFPHAISEWEAKHRGHAIEFRSPKRIIPRGLDDKLFQEKNAAPWWLEEFAPNADIKVAYASSAAYTMAIETTPLASSSTLVLGRESTAIDNTSNKYLDYLIGGKATLGTTPTAGRIELWTYASVNDTPTYPDVLDGTDSDETFTTVDIKNACLAFANLVVTTTTSNQTYWFRAFGLAQLYGGFVPKFHGLFLTHNTVAAMNSTAANHAFNHTGVYATSA